jgi:hypothetical protein
MSCKQLSWPGDRLLQLLFLYFSIGLSLCSGRRRLCFFDEVMHGTGKKKTKSCRLMILNFAERNYIGMQEIVWVIEKRS